MPSPLFQPRARPFAPPSFWAHQRPFFALYRFGGFFTPGGSLNAINPTVAAAFKGVVPDTLLYSEEELLAADLLRMQGTEARQRAASQRALQDQQQHLQMTGQLR